MMTVIGPYRVVSKLGEGGMGEVYRAHDPKLGRDVAIKVLPAALAHDADSRSRIEREARMLAALHHPHIATLFGVEDSTGIVALVMELVEGPTLAERIAGRPLPLKEALAIARQLAEALDAAHEKGIVHRDLKPANIKVMADGTVKVLDFGLARAVETAAGSESAVITQLVSQPGTIVGTAAYMSPEQARGQAVDKRTDIWAFGVVVYEMLTGMRAFTGGTTSDVLANVLQNEPDWAALPAATPPSVGRLLHRCLEKDPKRRRRDIGDVCTELADDAAAVSTGGLERRHSRVRTLAWIAVPAFLLVSVLSVWILTRSATTVPPLVRTTVTLPANQQLAALQTSAPIALSPDGRSLAYAAVSEGRVRLFVRRLDAFEASRLEDTDGARYPFFSPDGQSIAFFADGKLKRSSISGGAPITICDAPIVGRGGTWGPDGTIVFAAEGAHLVRVSASGGRPDAIASRDVSVDRRHHAWPQFLPDGSGLLSTIDGVTASGAVAVLSFKTLEWHVLVEGSQAQYLPPGYLVYHVPQIREGQLNVVAFDPKSLSVRGEAVTALDGAFRSANGGAAFFAAAQTGTMIFAPGGFARTLANVDRQGRRTPMFDERRGFRFPRFSPDGKRLAVTVDPRPSQIWVYDIERGSRIRLTTQGHNLVPVWTPDGQRVAFSAPGGIDWRVADAAQPAERLVQNQSAEVQNSNPTSWSSDGRVLLFQQQIPATDYDIWMGRQGDTPKRLVASRSRDLGGKLSHDGRWLAYYSDESGRPEVYVRPFPNVDARKWPISSDGGWAPVWSSDGRELFYMNGASMMSVSIAVKDGSLVAAKPQFLFDGPFDTTQDMNFDVAPDGLHFVMVEADPDAKPTKINVVLNWSGELRRLLTASK
jgi:serine/threonine protein kinase/Tol biopolymer transport system component